MNPQFPSFPNMLAQTHCVECGKLIDISDAHIVQQLSTKIIAQRDMLAAQVNVIMSKTGKVQALNRTIKHLLTLIPEDQQIRARELINQPKKHLR